MCLVAQFNLAEAKARFSELGFARFCGIAQRFHRAYVVPVLLDTHAFPGGMRTLVNFLRKPRKIMDERWKSASTGRRTACPTYFAKRLIQQGGAGGFACRSHGHNQWVGI